MIINAYINWCSNAINVLEWFRSKASLVKRVRQLEQWVIILEEELEEERMNSSRLAAGS